MRTPDDTLIFVAPQKAREIRRDQANCMGCLSHCKFSNWARPRRLHDRQAGRPALVLHPEDAAGDRPRSRRAARGPADVRRPQCLPLPRGPVLRQRLRPDGQAAGAAASSPAIERSGDLTSAGQTATKSVRYEMNPGDGTTRSSSRSAMHVEPLPIAIAVRQLKAERAAADPPARGAGPAAAGDTAPAT